MYFVYILQCADGSFYTGITPDLEARFEKHRTGKGSKYVRSRLPFRHVYTEELASKSEALKRELEIKSLSRSMKMKLIGYN